MGILIYNLSTQLLIHNDVEKSIQYIPKDGTVVSAVAGIVKITNGNVDYVASDPDGITLPTEGGLFDLVQVLHGYIEDNPSVGFRVPNMTTAERNALASPESGFLIFNTTTSIGQMYDGSIWNDLY
jgi:hypothetical protein